MKLLTTYSRRLLANCQTFCLLLPLLGFSPAGYADTTPPEQLIGVTQGFLEFTVEDYLQQNGLPGRYEIQVNNLDPRLRMPLCDNELTASLESPAQPLGRVTVKIRCEGSAPWSIFVPAQVKLFRDVVVAARPLKRGEVIGDADITLIERDTGLLNQGYLTEPSQAVGRKLMRPSQANQVLTPTFLQQAEAVRKGDQVQISARSGKINVHMTGEALSDGTVGQQIRVRNSSSQRVIKARVVGPGLVEVSM